MTGASRFAVNAVMENENETPVGGEIAEFNDSWKGRGNLGNLVKELDRQREARIDFVADVRHLRVEINGGVKLIPTTPQAFEWIPKVRWSSFGRLTLSWPRSASRRFRSTSLKR